MKTFPPLPALFIAVVLHAQPAPTPRIVTSTYLGGGGQGYTLDSAQAIARGADGAVYVAGETGSGPFPATVRIGEGPDGDGGFVVKYRPDGRIAYATFLLGLRVRAVAADAAGAAYLAGETGGYAPQASSAQASFGGNFDGFVAKLAPDGASLAYFTYVGGSQLELAQAVAVDATGAAYVGGWTTSPDFPATAGTAATLPGGRFEGFAAKIAPDGRSFVWATYLGGSGVDRVATCALDPAGRLVVGGRTTSTNFPSTTPTVRIGTASGRSEAYVARLAADGSAVERLTLITGEGTDTASRIAFGPDGSLAVLGETTSLEWPVTPGALQATNRGSTDLFVLRLSPELDTMLAGTLLGSPGTENASRQQYLNRFLLDGEPAGDGNVTIEAGGLAVRADGTVLVAATSFGEPVPGAAARPSGNLEALAAALPPTLGSLRWLLLAGGADYDFGHGIADDGAGGAWLVGEAGRPVAPPYFPTGPAPAQEDFGGGISDAFVMRVTAPDDGAPPNDLSTDAAPLSGTRIAVRGTNRGAGLEPGEPSHGGPGGASVWWRWTAPTNGMLVLDTAGSDFDTLLSARNGAGTARADDDAAPGRTTSRLRFPVAAGEEWRIAVDGKSGATGDVALTLRFSGPPNDDVADATVLSGFPAHASGSTIHASAETGDDVSGLGTPGGASVWWRWTATTNGNVAVALAGTIFQPVLGVYTGEVPGALELVQGDSGAGNPSGPFAREVTFRAVAGTTYRIGLDGFYGATGDYDLAVEPGTPPANDDFADRAPLKGAFARVTATNRRATFQRDAGEPPLVLTNSAGEPQGPGADNTVWWTWTAPDTGRVRIALTNANFDTRIAVLTGTALDRLVRVAADDAPFGERSSRVSFGAVAGTSYQIQVDGGNYDGRTGDFTLVLVLDHPPRILRDTLRRSGPDALAFEAEVVPGREVRLEASTDLRTWSFVSALVPDGPRATFGAPSATGTLRMFRLRADAAE